MEMDERKSLNARLVKGELLFQLVGMDFATLEQYYGTAKQFLSKGKTTEAQDAFFTLAMLNPLLSKYWMGLAMAEQMQGELEAAVEAYLMAELVEPSNPWIYYYAAKCYYGLGLKEEALHQLRSGEPYADGGVRSYFKVALDLVEGVST